MAFKATLSIISAISCRFYWWSSRRIKYKIIIPQLKIINIIKVCPVLKE